MRINLTSIRNIAKYAPHRVYALVLVGVGVIGLGLVTFAYGPERPTFTAENPATYVTFNSITNSPNYGDERNFTVAKDATNTAAGGFTETNNVQDGHEYLVRVLVHNNAAADLNLVAHNTRVSISVPATTGTSANIQATVSADNANPQQVWDGTVLTSASRFNVGYVPGSAHFYNAANPAGYTIPDTLTTSAGALLGYSSMNGDIPGCNQYSGVLTFKVKVTGVTPNFSVTKEVRAHGTTGWQKAVTANPGDSVDYLISYKNTGQTDQGNVVAKDSLPTGINYTGGTTKLTNTTNPNGTGTPDGLTAASGVNIGGYAPGGAAYVTFTSKIGDNDSLPQCGNNVLRNIGYIETDNGVKNDTADVTVNKKCENKASYSCDALQANKISQLEYNFNVNLSSDKATAKEVTIDFGDGQNAVRSVSSLPVSHTYAAPGQYTVSAKASFDVNGQTIKDVSSDACKVVVNTEVTPTTTNSGSAATPSSIASTGPAEVFGGVLGASAFGIGIQQWFASRRAVAEALHPHQ